MMKIAAALYIKVKTLEMGANKSHNSIKQKEIKISSKFKKYLSRMTEVIDGNCKKLPNTPVYYFHHDFKQENM